VRYNCPKSREIVPPRNSSAVLASAGLLQFGLRDTGGLVHPTKSGASSAGNPPPWRPGQVQEEVLKASGRKIRQTRCGSSSKGRISPLERAMTKTSRHILGLIIAASGILLYSPQWFTKDNFSSPLLLSLVVFVALTNALVKERKALRAAAVRAR